MPVLNVNYKAIAQACFIGGVILIGLYINVLRLEVAKLNAELTTEQTKNLNLESTAVTLKKELQDSNLRVQQLAAETAVKLEKGAELLKIAKQTTKEYQAEIEALNTEEPKGDTECERLSSALSDL